MPTRVPNMMRRNGTYYFRCRVPFDLRTRIQKTEVKFSLGTTDYHQARRRVAAAQYAVFSAFYGLRMTEKEKPFIPVFNAGDVARLSKDGKGHILEGNPDEMQSLLTNQLKDTLDGFVDVARQRDDSKQRAAEAESNVQRERLIADALAKKIGDGATSSASQNADPYAKLRPESSRPFYEFVEAFYTAVGITGNDRRNRDTAFKELRAIVRDKAIREINIDDVIDFHDAAKQKPGKHGNLASYKTVDKKLYFLRDFFKWCKDKRHLMADNPAEGYSADATKEEKQAGKKPKRSFTPDELTAIFHSPTFKGCKSLNRVFAPGNVKCRNHKFWFPVVALFSGLRLDELQQLEFADLVEFHDRLCLWVRHESQIPGYRKRLKNDASIRKVPLHPTLVEIGFLEYTKKRKNSQDKRVFQKYRYGHFFNEDLLLEKLDIKTPEISFNCLRHCFKDALRDATENTETIDRMCGHTVQGMGKVYGSGDLTKGQMAAIDRVEFPVDLTHLKA